jgi:hypothetical protein
MTDTFGDGWNQNLLQITDSNGNTYDVTIYDVNGEFTNTVWTTYEGGSATTVALCLPDGCTTMEWFDGSYVTETAFTVTDSDGTVLASGEDGILSQASFGVNDDTCVTSGCMDPVAENYDESANAPCDGCCTYIEGCTDEQASNYNEAATLDDGTCEYDCEGYEVDMSDFSCYWYVYVNGGYTVEEMIGYGYDCTCVEEPIVGCMDETATNYDPDAQVDGSCEYSTPSVSCDGAPVIGSYTYGNNESTMFSFLGNEGSTLQVSLTGQTESCCDDLNVYDGAGNLISTLEGEYEDQVVVSSDNGISIEFDSDGSFLTMKLLGLLLAFPKMLY